MFVELGYVQKLEKGTRVYFISLEQTFEDDLSIKVREKFFSI